MKVAEISSGVAAALSVRSTSGPFQPVPARGAEVALVRSADKTLLQCGADVWAVEGITASNTTQLNDVVMSGLPLLAYVAQATPDLLVIQARCFTQEIQIAEAMQIGLDEKVIGDLRSIHKVSGTEADLIAWLEDRLFMPPAMDEAAQRAGLRRMVISGDQRGRVDAFRIYGLNISADVRRIDDKLRIERVVRGCRTNNARLIVLSAPACIVDATLTAELLGAVRTTLAEAVSAQHSYLQTWQTYHRLEHESVMRRARSFGSLEYSSCTKRRDGGWSFKLKPLDDLAARLALLGEWSRFELEAGEHAPLLDEASIPVTPTTKAPRQKTQRLSASILNVDERALSIELTGPDEDDTPQSPPPSGYLYLSIAGDEVRLKRRERAEEALRTGNCPLPQLGLLMEGRPTPAARRSRVSVEGPKLKAVLREVFGAGRPTQRQLEAIEIALNTPDVCLIQGPPGTGKTKVITAIEQCLAVLADEGVEPSHRILVCAAQHDALENVASRTEVFGLPAVKVGRRRRGSDTGVDPAELFAAEQADKLRAGRRVPPEAERLTRARNIVLVCVRARSLPHEQAARIRELLSVLDGLLPPGIRDRAVARACYLERPVGLGDPEEAKKLENAASNIRVDDGTFSDDGQVKARVALKRLDKVLTAEERAFLERSAAAEPGSVPPWLGEGRALRDALIDRLIQKPQTAEPRLDDDTQRLLLEILDAVEHRMTTTRLGDESVLTAYLHDLESDPEGVRHALEHYTVVLAATLQQAAGTEMRRVLRIDEGEASFESVIVDEAARAHPLDLFIPLSMAKRRVVLVGDHRQLPHLLEPDVERQLAEGADQSDVAKQTLDAVQASLFERMWILLRALEHKDGIQRTVTLNAQYRMHPVLGAYVSEQFYERHDDGAVESPRPAAQFTHDLPGYVKHGAPCAAAWLDVSHGRGREVRGVSKSRPAEARAIAKEVRRLIDHDSQLTFGVIAFYSAQVDEIGRAMIAEGLTETFRNARGWRVAERWETTTNNDSKQIERLRIGTVDAFQGKEFDVVFLSITRSNELPGETDEQQRRKFGHLMLENRLCVAMSRQQRLLVAVGDLAFVKAEDARQPLRALHAFAELCGGEHGIIR
jgi:hypothetical protein